MEKELLIEHRPELNHPILVVGFEGWPNGGNVAVGMLDYLIQTLGATRFARVDLHHFCRFDDVRPTVVIKQGDLKKVLVPQAVFYAAPGTGAGTDLILLKSHEPQFRWNAFVEIIVSLCKEMGVGLIVTLGGLQDNVVHTETVISGLASTPHLLDRLKQNEVIPIDYEGPGAIHAFLLQQCNAMGIQGISLWGHCPFYVQGTHLRVLSRMASVLADLTGLHLDTTELEKGWMQLARQIQHFVDQNPELQKVIKDLTRSRTTTKPPAALKRNGNVIYLDDSFGPKRPA
jgi:proteasome assembly chaperone (PAC2) family protein